MTIDQMRLFVLLCSTLNFTRAAEKAFMTQEGLSYQIRQMEKELGYPLFVRNHKQVEMTEEGQKWRHAAESILQTYDKTDISIRNEQDGSRSVLNISFYAYEYSSALEWFRSFHDDYPQIEFRVLTETDGNILHMLCDFSCDVLYAGRELTEGYPMLAFEPIGQYCNGFVVSKNHPLARHSSLSWNDVALETMILPAVMTSDPMKSQNVTFQRILAENCPGARILYSSDFSSSLTMVELGMGLMPTSFDVRQIGEVVGSNCIQIPRSPIYRNDLGIIFHKDNPKECLMDFIRHLRKHKET